MPNLDLRSNQGLLTRGLNDSSGELNGCAGVTKYSEIRSRRGVGYVERSFGACSSRYALCNGSVWSILRELWFTPLR